MTLLDSSAWVEFLRATGSGVHLEVRRLVSGGGEVHTTDVVVSEVLSGARDEDHAARLRRLLLGCAYVPTRSEDYESAAAIYRRCRRGGVTPRALNDCLIAAVAIRSDLALLHRDRDYAAIGRHSALKLA